MNCAEVERDEYIERYLRGELEEGEAQALEEHYVSCDRCFRALEELSPLRTELVKERWAVEDEKTPARWQWGGWTGAWLGAAAVVAVAVGLGFWLASRPPGTEIDPRIAELSAVEPPPYTARTLRSTASRAERLFEEAMTLYEQGDYAAAIPGLEAAASADPESRQVLFYLGACYLLADQPQPAAEALGRLVDLGPSLYLERGRFLRAQALLRMGDLSAARTELEAVVSLGGDMNDEARRLLGLLSD
jgi:tetratricopeptide (TPR) repeat protein